MISLGAATNKKPSLRSLEMMEVEWPFPPGYSHTSLGLEVPHMVVPRKCHVLCRKKDLPSCSKLRQQAGRMVHNLLWVIAIIVGRSSSEWCGEQIPHCHSCAVRLHTALGQYTWVRTAYVTALGFMLAWLLTRTDPSDSFHSGYCLGNSRCLLGSRVWSCF